MMTCAVAQGTGFSVWYADVPALVALLVFPALLLAYLRETCAVRRRRPDFALRKFETLELNRAVRQLQAITFRLDTLRGATKATNKLWWLLGREAHAADDVATERDDLELHARQLRPIIIDLRHRPLRRLQALINANNSQFALGKAIWVHLMSLGLLILLALDELPRANWPVAMPVVAGQLLYANAAASAFALLAMPIFHVLRRQTLRSRYDLELCIFGDLANLDPEQSMDDSCRNAADDIRRERSSEPGARPNWRDVLGLPQQATIDEIKTAYRARIKQNHPDRVSGMSDAFQKLAERQTKTINVAYQQALSEFAVHG